MVFFKRYSIQDLDNDKFLYISVPYFNYSLPCDVEATGFILRNTHNDIANDAGTRELTILSDTNSSDVLITLDNPQNMVRVI